MKRLFAAIALLTTMASAVPGQISQESHQKLRAAADTGDNLKAISLLEDLRRADQEAFELNNYGYLLGRLYERTGDLGGAAAQYQVMASGDSILKEYGLFDLAALGRTTGNLVLERMYLSELAAYEPEMPLSAAALNRRARSFFDSGNYEEAIRVLISPLPDQPDSTPSDLEKRVQRDNQLLLAKSYLQSGRTSEAAGTFAAIAFKTPDPARPDDYSLEAVIGLDSLDQGSGLSNQERLERAHIYQFNREYADARRHYTALIREVPAGDDVPQALFEIGRGFAAEENFGEAVLHFERIREQFPDHRLSKEALLHSGSGYSRLQKYREAIARYQMFIQQYPDDERVDRAYLNIIDVFRDQGEEVEALNWCSKVREVFSGKLPEAIAIFTRARIHMARSDWNSAYLDLDRLRAFADLGGNRVPGGTSKPETDFLRAYVLEKLGRIDEAIDVYLSIDDGRAEYYGWLATARLRSLASVEPSAGAVERKKAALSERFDSSDASTRRNALQAALRLNDPAERRGELLSLLAKTYSAIDSYRDLPKLRRLELGRTQPQTHTAAAGPLPGSDRARELLFLGLNDQAALELEAGLTTVGPNARADGLQYTLAVLSGSGANAARATELIESLYRPLPSDFQIELIPREHLELMYPAPFASELLSHAGSRQVDPRFLLSLMRQESRFRPDAKSEAAARGPMQFISSTALRTAGELGWLNFHNEDLYNPDTSILLGSHYVSSLFKIFRDQPAAVAGSYNAGDSNMKRWYARARSDRAEQYVPEINFSQTKDYVYKVMTNYRIYQYLYNESLRRRDRD